MRPWFVLDLRDYVNKNIGGFLITGPDLDTKDLGLSHEKKQFCFKEWNGFMKPCIDAVSKSGQVKQGLSL